MAATIRLSQQHSCSFDHLIGAAEQLCWHFEPERLGGLQVDHQLELDWGLDRKLTCLLSLEDAIDITRRAPKIIVLVNDVGQQATDFSEVTVWIDSRETIASC